MKIRKAVTIYKDEIAYTFLRPLSGEHQKTLFVIFEDAFGEAVTQIMTKDQIFEELQVNISETEYEEIQRQLI